MISLWRRIFVATQITRDYPTTKRSKLVKYPHDQRREPVATALEMLWPKIF